MKILAIETSCDETAISVVDATGDMAAPHFRVLSAVVTSQLAVHVHWGGVVPSLAKREHQRALIPALKAALVEAKTPNESRIMNNELWKNTELQIREILSRETELLPSFLEFIFSTETPDIDAIAVTQGPGLEPALWVGVNCARALSVAWNKPLIPVNHMEGHFLSAAIEPDGTWRTIAYPAVALLVSGGHTEIVLSERPGTYKILGQTRDDAVGEAFDKVARLLGLPYPGGPQISKLALLAQNNLNNSAKPFSLPRPMIKSGNYDFSFSGLKTAVLYLIRDLEVSNTFDDTAKQYIAHEFQTAALEVLVAKTVSAAREFRAHTIIVGGGVSANKKLHTMMEQSATHEIPNVRVFFPTLSLSTDNATMIALAGYIRALRGETLPAGTLITAHGTLRI